MHGGSKGSGRPKVHGRRSKQAQREQDFVRAVRLLLSAAYKRPHPREVPPELYEGLGITATAAAQGMEPMRKPNGAER